MRLTRSSRDDGAAATIGADTDTAGWPSMVLRSTSGATAGVAVGVTSDRDAASGAREGTARGLTMEARADDGVGGAIAGRSVIRHVIASAPPSATMTSRLDTRIVWGGDGWETRVPCSEPDDSASVIHVFSG